MIQQLLSEICQIDIGVGTIAKLRMHVSEALEQPVQEAHQYVLTQPLVNMDETGFQQGNADGNNRTGKKAWLWVMSTPLVIYFSVTKSRSTDSAVELLSEEFEGILGSDRYRSYNWVNLAQRQLCWAHLKRDFQRIAERSGVSAEIGQNLLAVTSELFDLWYEVRAGTLSRAELVERVIPIRATLLSSLQLAAKLEIGVQEKTPLAKTVRTCRQLLKVEPALWTFIYTEGIEPTNNAAERAIRPAVLWRKNSFGSQSEAGSLFVARMMTVVSTLRAQGRQVLDYLVASLEAHRSGHPSPSILPLG
jgi:transposase